MAFRVTSSSGFCSCPLARPDSFNAKSDLVDDPDSGHRIRRYGPWTTGELVVTDSDTNLSLSAAREVERLASARFNNATLTTRHPAMDARDNHYIQ